MDEQHLEQPLLPISTTTVATTTTMSTKVNDLKNTPFSIALRLLLLILIGVVSMWANQQASKGLGITVVNDLKNTPLGEKFSLFYLSNDEIIRLVQSASEFATKVLYSNSNMHEIKVIEQLNIQVVNGNLSHHEHIVVDKHLSHKNKYVLSISPMVMEYRDYKYEIQREIQRCMAKILLFDGGNAAPKALLDGMIEYISISAGVGGDKLVIKSRNFNGKCWEDKDPKVVARFLDYCERRNEGFLSRLNQEMREGWDEGMVDRAIVGMLSAKQFCTSFDYYSSMNIGKNEDMFVSKSISSYR